MKAITNCFLANVLVQFASGVQVPPGVTVPTAPTYNVFHHRETAPPAPQQPRHSHPPEAIPNGCWDDRAMCLEVCEEPEEEYLQMKCEDFCDDHAENCHPLFGRLVACRERRD